MKRICRFCGHSFEKTARYRFYCDEECAGGAWARRQEYEQRQRAARARLAYVTAPSVTAKRESRRAFWTPERTKVLYRLLRLVLVAWQCGRTGEEGVAAAMAALRGGTKLREEAIRGGAR